MDFNGKASEFTAMQDGLLDDLPAGALEGYEPIFDKERNDEAIKRVTQVFEDLGCTMFEVFRVCDIVRACALASMGLKADALAASLDGEKVPKASGTA